MQTEMFQAFEKQAELQQRQIELMLRQVEELQRQVTQLVTLQQSGALPAQPTERASPHEAADVCESEQVMSPPIATCSTFVNPSQSVQTQTTAMVNPDAIDAATAAKTSAAGNTVLNENVGDSAQVPARVSANSSQQAGTRFEQSEEVFPAYPPPTLSLPPLPLFSGNAKLKETWVIFERKFRTHMKVTRTPKHLWTEVLPLFMCDSALEMLHNLLDLDEMESP
ncbi:MAG: hypothetical protein GY820_40385, partial [Gammaproteobacteria bacterium]|nr:hypothetical protein [Gammaproteobacteria bacterium]